MLPFKKLSQTENTETVKAFFDRNAVSYDAYHAPDKFLMRRILDYLFRQSMARRFELVCRETESRADTTVLDVGCGSGYYSIALARKEHIAKVVGIDHSPVMIERARKRAAAAGADTVCEFINGEFDTASIDKKYDIVLAIGFFDYIDEPEKHLRKICAHTGNKSVISFPAKWRLRNIVRIVRLRILGCPVYFYTLPNVKNLLKKAGFDTYRIENLGRDYVVIAET